MNKQRENSKLLGELAKTGKVVSLIAIGNRPIMGKVSYKSNDRSATPGNENYYFIDTEGRKVRPLYAKDIIQGVNGDNLAFSVIGLDDSYRKEKRNYKF